MAKRKTVWEDCDILVVGEEWQELVQLMRQGTGGVR
jgi:hypothetical protein